MATVSALTQLATRVALKVTSRRRETAFNTILSQGLPSMLVEPARYLLTNEARPHVLDVQKRV